MYGFIADGIVLFHVLYVSYVVLGQIAIWIGWLVKWNWIRNFWFRATHLLAIGIVVFEELMNLRCPLTIWEETFRVKAGQSVTGESFLGRLLHTLIFYDVSPLVFRIGYIAAGIIILMTFVLCRPHRPSYRRASIGCSFTNSPGL